MTGKELILKQDSCNENRHVREHCTPSQHNTHITKQSALHPQSAQYPHYRTPSIAPPVSTIPTLQKTHHCNPSQHNTHITEHPTLHPQSAQYPHYRTICMHPKSAQYPHYRTPTIAPPVGTIPTLKNTQHCTPSQQNTHITEPPPQPRLLIVVIVKTTGDEISPSLHNRINLITLILFQMKT